MFKGISFTMKQEANTNILQSILKNINIEYYKWYNILDQNEVLSSSFKENTFNCNYYSGKSFEKEIKKEHYIIFLKLQAYLCDKNFFNIHTYDDLINSNCQILILIYDSEFVEIYSQDEIVIKNIYNNAILSEFNDIEFISDIQTYRKRMDVL